MEKERQTLVMNSLKPIPLMEREWNNSSIDKVQFAAPIGSVLINKVSGINSGFLIVLFSYMEIPL